MQNPRQNSRLICLIGSDGVGKSTLVQHIIDFREAEGVRAKRVWFRYPFLFSIPILVYCRMSGLSYYQEHDGVRFGRWEFWRSRWVPQVFPWLQLIDTAIYLYLFVRLPLWLGRDLICDRFIHDVLVDIMAGISDHQLYIKRVGQLFIRLVPDVADVVCIDATWDVIRRRRPDLIHDATWQVRRDLYHSLSKELEIPIVDNSRSVVLTQIELRKLLGSTNL